MITFIFAPTWKKQKKIKILILLLKEDTNINTSKNVIVNNSRNNFAKIYVKKAITFDYVDALFANVVSDHKWE